jgi:hypothetical protein
LNKYAGKARIGVVAAVGAAAIAIVGLHRFSGRAYSAGPTGTLFVTDDCSDAVTAYSAASNGDVPPLATGTGLSGVEFVAIDASGNIYATNACNGGTVTIYAKGSNGDAAPIAVIGGSKTGLISPAGIALDPSRNIYVADGGATSVFVYPALGSSTGLLNESPTATISGGTTGLNSPQGIALDSNRNIYVADNAATSVFVYSAIGSSTGTLNEAPTATISGGDTGLNFPEGIALDSSGKIYVADDGASGNGPGSLFVYPAIGSSTGLLNEAPTASITGGSTGLSYPYGITLDSSRNIYVANQGNNGGSKSVVIYPALGSSTGTLNESPTATISGGNTELRSGHGIALDSSDNIFVADGGSNVTVFPPVGSSTGTLNEDPSAVISTTVTTGLHNPYGVALDSSGRIYVANEDHTTSGVLVYAAGSNGNAAPSTSITGDSTGLYNPQGIALDSSGDIYVTDDGDFVKIPPPPPSVFVYPALGSSTGVLDEGPSATISGGNTSLITPEGIALDSSRNIYVADVGAASVFVYSAGTNGNKAPSATIKGSSTLLESPAGIALDSSRNIYVADDGDGNCDGTESVYVYSEGSTGDVAPVATISGGNTGLCYPYGIALDSSGDIYVADDYAESVFVFPPLGSSTGLLNEFPSATITGPLTQLGEPEFVAIQPAATPTATATATRTATPAPSATATGGTPTATATGGTPTATATATATKTATATPTATGSGAPTATATATKTATATPTATGSGAPTATATATPTATPTVTPTAVSSPTTLSASPTTIKFGNVDATATSKSKKVTLTNKGTAEAVIGTVTATPPFEIAGGANTCSGQTIAVKKKCSFEAEFSPATPGAAIDGSIKVTYNGTSPTMSLSGAGIAVTLKAPSKETFSSVAAGGTGKSKNIKISNPATVGVSLGTTSIGGSDPSAFTITANSCTGTLVAKGNCTITMEFTPKSGATGGQSATVGFSYTYGANGGSLSVPISGTVK